MDEDTTRISLKQLKALGKANAEFQDQWDELYDDWDCLYGIREEWPDVFDQICRVSLHDIEEATHCGRTLFNDTVKKLEWKRDSLDPDDPKKKEIKKWLRQMHNNLEDNLLKLIETVQQTRKQEKRLYEEFSETRSKEETTPAMGGTCTSRKKTPFDVKGRRPSGVEGSRPSGVKETRPSDVKGTRPPDVKGTSLSDVNRTSLSDVKGTRPSDVKITTPSDVKGTRPSDVKGTSPSDVKGTRSSDVKGTSPPDVKGTSSSDVNELSLYAEKGTTIPRSKCDAGLKRLKEKDKSIPCAETKGDLGSEVRQGVCVILDLVNRADDVKTVKNLFTYLGYAVHELEYAGRDAVGLINRVLKKSVTEHDRSALVFVIDTETFIGSSMEGWVHKYRDVFDEIAQLYGKPKILITHGQYRPRVLLPLPYEDNLHICSQIVVKAKAEIRFQFPGGCDTFVKGDKEMLIFELRWELAEVMRITTRRILKLGIDTGNLRVTYEVWPGGKDEIPVEDAVKNMEAAIERGTVEYQGITATRGTFTVTNIEEKSLFVETLDRILRRYNSHYDLYELLTKVLRDVEIQQHIRKRDGKTSFTETDPYHRVVFQTALKSPFKFGSSDVLETSPESTYSRGKHEDAILSTHGSFCLLPGQLTGLERISEHELKKVFSVEVEVKGTKEFYKVNYPMDQSPRGLCVIVNLSNDRPGSLIDEAKMKQLFEELDFEIRIISNRTHEEIDQEVTKLASDVPRLHQCLVVLIMGHGQADKKTHMFVDVKGLNRSSDYVLDAFKMQKNLIGKPKLFIIQTCFGVGTLKMQSADKVDTDAAPVSTPVTPITEPQNMEELFAIHKDSDTIILNATLEEYKSYRIPLQGTFLIQALDKVIRENSMDKDFSQLMTLVKKEVLQFGVEKEALQQAKEVNILNLHLRLNPGYSVMKQPSLPDINEDNNMSMEYSVLWEKSANSIVVADRQANWLKVVDTVTTSENIYHPSNMETVTGILNGVSVRGRDESHPDEHVIVKMANDNRREAVYIKLEGNTWSELGTLVEDNPLTLCSVNNDGIAVISGEFGSSDAEIHIYSCDNIHAIPENSSIIYHGKPVKLTNTLGAFSDAEPLCLGINDKMCYSLATFYICCAITSMVYQVSFSESGNMLKGKIEHTYGKRAPVPGLGQPGSLYKPCGVFTRKEGEHQKLIVACYDGVHQGTLNTSTGETNWTHYDPYASGNVEGFWYNKDVFVTLTHHESRDHTPFRLKEISEVNNKHVVTMAEKKDILHIISNLPGNLINTSEEDTIIVCSENTPQCSVINITKEGNRIKKPKPKVYTLTEGDFIKSGVLICTKTIGGKKYELYMLVVGYGFIDGSGERQFNYSVCTILLDLEGLTSIHLSPIYKSELEYDVIHAFQIDAHRFGVLCRRKNSSGSFVNCVCIYTLDMLEKTPKVADSKLHQAPVITLTGSDGDACNTICVTNREMFYCLAVREQHEIQIFSLTGRFITTLGKGLDGREIVTYPRSVICSETDIIYVIGYYRQIDNITPDWGVIRKMKGEVFDHNSAGACGVDNNDENDEDEYIDLDEITNSDDDEGEGRDTRVDDRKLVSYGGSSAAVAVRQTPVCLTTVRFGGSMCFGIMTENYAWCNEVMDVGGAFVKKLCIYPVHKRQPRFSQLE